MISAEMVWENPLKAMQAMYAGENATENDYMQALLGYQNVTEEMKSVQRTESEEFYWNE